MKSKRLFKLFTTLVPIAAIACATTTRASASAIYTSKGDGTTVNANVYASKADVYVNGGPQNKSGGGGLDPGCYFFEVTDPNGGTLLSSDPAANRKLYVDSTGHVYGVGTCGGTHAEGSLNVANGSIPVQLIDFADTPNNGGEYKVAVISVDKAQIDADGLHLIYDSKDSATDNFKIRSTAISLTCQKDIEDCISPNTVSKSESFAATTTGGADPVTITYSIGGNVVTSPYVFPLGQTTVDVLAVDANGAATTCSFTVTISNTGCTPSGGCPVVFTLPSNGGAQCFDQTAFDAWATATATVDGNAVAPTQHVSSSTTGCKTVYSVYWTVADCNSLVITSDTRKYTVEDTEAPTIHTPNGFVSELTVHCIADVPTAPTMTVTDNCKSGLTAALDQRSTGSGSCDQDITRTWTASDGCNDATPVTQVIHVVITPPSFGPVNNYSQCLKTINGNTITVTPPTASDSCGAALTAVPDRDLTKPFTVGTTTITWTATDSCGKQSQTTSTVIISAATVTVRKFYDANANGQDDDNQVVNGLKITLYGTDTAGNPVGSALSPLVAYTGADVTQPGIAVIPGIPAGTYTVTEVPSSASTWVNTSGGTSHTVVVLADGTGSCLGYWQFGNYCTVLGKGGLTIGFWGNSNGAVVLKTDTNWPNKLSALNLRDGTGKFVGGSGSPATALFTLTSLDQYLQAASATNMAYMLSAQLTGLVLNVEYGATAKSKGYMKTDAYSYNLVVVLTPAEVACLGAGDGLGGKLVANGNTTTIGALKAAAVTTLGNIGYTVQTGQSRTYQNCLEQIFDDLNNNRRKIANPVPCTP